MQTVELDRKLIGYLLGSVSDRERLEIEDRYLSNAEFFDELLVAEDELIDSYVRNRLSSADRNLFERNFLCSPARMERVKSARALMKFAELHGTASRVSFWQRLQSSLRVNSPAMGLTLAVSLMLLIAVGSLLVVQLSKLRSELQEVRTQQLAQKQREQELQQLVAQQSEQNLALSQSLNSVSQDLERERSQHTELEQLVASLREQQAPPPVFPIPAAEPVRGGGSLTPPVPINVPRGAKFIRLRLDLSENRFESYMAVLEDAQQKELRKLMLQRPKSTSISVSLPTSLLVKGKYNLKLRGKNNSQDYQLVAEYPFEVTKK